MNGLLSALPPSALPWVAIALGAGATYASRYFGVLLSGRIAAESRAIEWLTCVTYALLAGLIARMIILPLGSLNQADMWMRLVAVGLCLSAFYGFHRSVAAGVLAGTLSMVAMLWLGA